MPSYILNKTYTLFWCTAIHCLFQIDRQFLIGRHGSSAACGLLSLQPTIIAQQRKVSLDFKSAARSWRMKSKIAEQLREYEGRIAAAAAEDDQSRKMRERKAKEREEVMET